jgi:S-DNA-T family DNA segregation ATPase FtsK/SpoIIIE
MYREERVALARYHADPPAVVADQVSMAADLCALVFTRLTPDQLARPLVYNYPAPMERDVAWLGRHTVHEGEHHLGDVRTVLDRVGVTGG